MGMKTPREEWVRDETHPVDHFSIGKSPHRRAQRLRLAWVYRPRLRISWGRWVSTVQGLIPSALVISARLPGGHGAAASQHV
jgi:hypothetical protein